MKWTEAHTDILRRAFAGILGTPRPGTMAFVRCLTPRMVSEFVSDCSRPAGGWEIRRVANSDDEETRTITADRAVEMREMKAQAKLLLIDTELAGAGMDGIYSATREVDEENLFREALEFAEAEITRKLSAKDRRYAQSAISKAQAHGLRSVSPEVKFDFLCQIIASGRHPGEHIHLLGLWPVAREAEDARTADEELSESRMFVDRLLEAPVAALTPLRRIESMRFLCPTEQQSTDIERFLRAAATKPLLSALSELANKRHLWINNLRIEGSAQSIQGIELSPWRTNTGKIAKWSGLSEGRDPKGPPELVLNPDPDRTGIYSKFEVKWKARPSNLEKDAAQYHVVIMTDMDEELAAQDVPHSGKREEKCRFSDDYFQALSEGARIPAKIVLSVIGNLDIEPQESEEFFICFGQPTVHEQGGVGKKVRTLSEGLIELEDREAVSALASSNDRLSTDSKGFVLLRTAQRAKSFRVFRPALIKEIEILWSNERQGALGRWRVRVRASGERASRPEFSRFAPPEKSPATEPLWRRTATASRKMADRFYNRSGVGQIYDEKSKAFEADVKEYLLAWAALLDGADPHFALANTVEVQSLSGRTIGLIVLPSHPLRMAWHAAYDNLVFHAAFDQGMDARAIIKEFSGLDGAMFPAFLPGLEHESSFIFADMLGFHAVGMVPDTSTEPKAAVAILARALGGSEMADTTPTVGEQSTKVLGGEIIRYLDCHDTSRLLSVHALRAGDGFTVARSLGFVHRDCAGTEDGQESEEVKRPQAPVFVLEFYPSSEQRAIAGRFITEAQEKRRSRAGTVSAEDQWMLGSLSLPGNISIPKLRWARKNEQNPATAAHLAIAFDTFESRLTTEEAPGGRSSRPFYAFGLMSFFERKYSDSPSPLWDSALPALGEGEKHPSDRTHTERLARLGELLQKLVARNIGSGNTVPVLRTEISVEKAESLKMLHRQCDWVITLDRNAGIEYFDSPRSNKEIYDAYVIDCVPEREDLGCLQLITSTANLEEVRDLLDDALNLMGLSRSRQKAEFLFHHLKALSGRLAIRFTGQKAPTSELIALALCHANCVEPPDDDCWVSLEEGFFVPVDDILDLLGDVVAGDDTERKSKSRSDLIYVSMKRKGLGFRFFEVKYRRHLRTARAPGLLNSIREQTESMRRRWNKWYGNENVCGPFRAIRRAKLARVLRFYADKARRHHLSEDSHRTLSEEIDRMIKTGGNYSFARTRKADRGWVFCPEYAGAAPSEISPEGWSTRIFLFGPSLIPDSGFYPGDAASSEEAPQPDTQEAAPISDETETNDMGNSEKEPEPPVNQAPSMTLGTDTFTGDSVSWQLAVKGNPHLLLAGLPGMGKTTCLLNLCRQMLSADIRPIIFSYHLDIDEKLQEMVPSVRFIDFNGLGFNPLQVIDRESPRAYLDVAGALRDIFTAIFPELGDIQGERIRKAIRDSFVELGWGNAVGEGIEEPEFRRFVEILRDDPKPDRGLKTLLARLGELEDYGFFDLRDSYGSLWESKEPTIIRIHKTQNDNLQKAFASLVFYGIYKDMFRRGTRDRVTHAVIFDEAHRAAGMKLIPTMAKECRKFGISLVLASQEAKDFNTSVFSAIANYLVLRLTEMDAKILVRNVANSQQERVLIDKVKQMEKFRALFFREGKQRPYPVSLSPSE